MNINQQGQDIDNGHQLSQSRSCSVMQAVVFQLKKQFLTGLFVILAIGQHLRMTMHFACNT